MGTAQRATTASVLFWGAAIAGIVHAASSLYWAVGGRMLLETVGQWAIEAMATDRTRAVLVLSVTGLLKLSAALLPLGVAYGLVPWERFWRTLAWPGAIGLIGYGSLHVVLGVLVLSGIIRPDGGYDHDAIFGHAAIWGPLFMVWGLLLAGALWLSQPGRRARSRERGRRLVTNA